jgi:lysophospholipase L1-like esterase
MPVLPEAGGARDGVLGVGAAVWSVLIAGDSSAAGVGVALQDQAFAGHFTRALHARCARTLQWSLRARSGLTTAQLRTWLAAQCVPRADVVVVLSGVNDVIDRIPVRRAMDQRAALARWLLTHGQSGAVVYAPLPPFDQFEALPQPLRRVMGRQARRHNRGLAAASMREPGVHYTEVPIELTRAGMASDGFHPGEPVYRGVARTLARFVADNVLKQENPT